MVNEMMRDVDKYTALNSYIHRFDPRAKIISFISLIFSVVFLSDIRTTALCLAVSLVLLIISKIPLRFTLRKLMFPSVFIIFIFIALSLTVPGEALFRFYIITVTYEGLYEGVLIVLRAFSALILAFLLVSTTRFDDIIKALNSLRFPKPLTQILMLSYRYAFVFSDEIERMLTAMQARGFRMEAKMHSLKAIGKALGMLFVRCSERSERVYEAMLSRGYSSEIKTLSNFNMRAVDYVLCMLFLLFAVFLHW
ncbi:MAG: cobalt ECF transporter T component CbiQ [Canidatus Methanoxibalbensis ujae]|nr:cobalt ECF transporter T component CbiQ [Candidatus Methanoxibalbensis ujae]